MQMETMAAMAKATMTMIVFNVKGMFREAI